MLESYRKKENLRNRETQIPENIQSKHDFFVYLSQTRRGTMTVQRREPFLLMKGDAHEFHRLRHPAPDQYDRRPGRPGRIPLERPQ